MFKALHTFCLTTALTAIPGSGIEKFVISGYRLVVISLSLID